MGHDEEGWKQFTMTGKVEDYLKYRFDDVKETERGLMRADNNMSAVLDEETYDGRDIYGDGNGSVGTTRRRI
jgi:hypothetical protein